MPEGVKQSSSSRNRPPDVFKIEGFWEVLFAWHMCEELLLVPEMFL